MVFGWKFSADGQELSKGTPEKKAGHWAKNCPHVRACRCRKRRPHGDQNARPTCPSYGTGCRRMVWGDGRGSLTRGRASCMSRVSVVDLHYGHPTRPSQEPCVSAGRPKGRVHARSNGHRLVQGNAGQVDGHGERSRGRLRRRRAGALGAQRTAVCASAVAAGESTRPCPRCAGAIEGPARGYHALVRGKQMRYRCEPDKKGEEAGLNGPAHADVSARSGEPLTPPPPGPKNVRVPVELKNCPFYPQKTSRYQVFEGR